MLSLLPRPLNYDSKIFSSEKRVDEPGVCLPEIAARPVGGLCVRIQRHALSIGLDAWILHHAQAPSCHDVSCCRPHQCINVKEGKI